ncbi:hypothetical protein GGR58DRAFT_470083 [Xylaria digitata]|nr:hypothetical protein GGR58DRAFT_470083 [Xylaria digitata]
MNDTSLTPSENPDRFALAQVSSRALEREIQADVSPSGNPNSSQHHHFSSGSPVTLYNDASQQIFDAQGLSEASSDDHKELWTPIWFQKKSLFAFLAMFTASWASLILLWRYDINYNGFAINLSSSHYSWTYGPTVVLTFMISLWRQLDYFCKLAQPWKTMTQGPADSTKSLLLDYISPLQITSAFKAFRNRHWAVLASIVGLSLLKVGVVISTALLVLTPTSLSETIRVTTTTKFDDKNIWNIVRGSSDDGKASIYPATVSQDDIAYYFSSPGPLYAYQGILQGLPNPQGTQDGITFQSIKFDAARENMTTVSTNVEAFIPNVSCEIARMTVRIAGEQTIIPNEPSPLGIFTLDTASCSVGHFSYTITPPLCNTPSPALIRVNCSEDLSMRGWHDFNTPQIPIDSKTPYDFRVAVFAIDTAFCDGKSSSHDQVDWLTMPPNGTATICKVDYKLEGIRMVQTAGRKDFQLDIPDFSSAPDRLFSNFTGLELGEVILALISWWDNGLTFSNIMLKSLADPLATPNWFLDSELLLNKTQVALSGIAAQVLQQYALVPGDDTAEGTCIYSENRLHIQPISLWLLVADFFLLSLLTVSIMYSIPCQSTPKDPGSIAACATIMASSPSIQELLAKTGHLRTSELTKWLDGHIFKTAINSSGYFEIKGVGAAPLFHKKAPTSQSSNLINRSSGVGGQSTGEHYPTLQPKDIITKKGQWMPLPGRMPFVVITIMLPILAIAILEILFQISERQKGLVDVEEGSPSAYVRYPTSLIAIVIATMFNSLDFTSAAFAPFAALRFGSRSNLATRFGLLTNLLGEIPPVALYKSLYHKQYSTALLSAAALIGSVLTIVASGLWVVDPYVNVTTGIETFSTTKWDLNWRNSSSNDGNAAAVLSSIEFGGLPGSDGVWGDLVFPTLSNFTFVNEADVVKYPILSSNVSLEIPSLRPHIECESVSPESFQFKSVDRIRAQLSGRIDLPQGCSAGPDGNHSYATVDNTNFTLRDGPKWIGWLLDLHMGPWDKNTSKGFSDLGEGAISERTGYLQPDNPNGCPSIVILFAHLDPAEPSTENITGLLCSQKIQQVQTRLVIGLDSTRQISPQSLRSEPAPIESTARYMTNGSEGVDAFNYRIQPHLESEFVVYNDFALQREGLDVFFEQLVLGPSRVSLEDLEGANNIENLKRAVNNLYKKYMVQVINTSIFRRDLTDSEQAVQRQQQPIIGTVSTKISRLKVDFTSKLILQIMLAVMSFSGGIGWWKAKLRCTLPRNPCSIASVMALLSESRICDRRFMPNNAEWMSKQRLSEVFDGHVASLGWWDESNVRVHEISKVGNEDGNWRFGLDLETL